LILFFLRYLRFWLRSGNAHGLHSPFVYNLYTQVLRDKSKVPIFEIIENERNLFLADKSSIFVEDFGTGSSKSRAVNEIAGTSLKKPFLAQQIYRLVQYLNPKKIVELGTSLGITTQYMANAVKESQLISIEGSAALSKKAQELSVKLGNDAQIEFRQGNIDDLLPAIVYGKKNIDFAFVDANHTYEATCRYFDIIKQAIDIEKGCVVIDDIHWSGDMQRAWEKILADKDVTVSIDTFFFGIVFFHKTQPKQHFVLRC
jgi:predicted O-methyltransferase YrrM